jgi:hypothetical protein
MLKAVGRARAANLVELLSQCADDLSSRK